MKVVKYFLFLSISAGFSSVYAQTARDTITRPFAAPKQLGTHLAPADSISAFSAPRPLGVHDRVSGDTASKPAVDKNVKTAPQPFLKSRSLEHNAVSTPPAKPAPPNAVLQWEAVTGTAANDVFIVTNPKGSCNNGLTAINFINTSAGKAVIATIEITTKYGGHVSKKIATIDNMAPTETRQIGCMGCMESSTFKSCFTYKILTANYK